jgi:hypothetical protein
LSLTAKSRTDNRPVKKPGVNRDTEKDRAAGSRYVYLKKPVAVVIKNEIYEGRSLLKVRLKAYVQDLRFEFAFASDMTERVMQYLLAHGMVTGESLAGIKSASH